MKLELRRAARYYYLRFVRLKGHPGVLARGVAIGTFVGITPTIPFHTILSLLFAFILRGSKIAALFSTIIVSNPITFLPQYYLSWQIGNWLTPGKHSWKDVSILIDAIINGGKFGETLTALGQIGMESLIILLAGGMVLALPFTLFFYCLSYMLFRSIQKKQLEKKILK
ncbi:MAG: DUF2062 domain-containing protein [Desulfobulbaceae bacterium]|jgi:uncharacterized protein|nr:DUF2062 domain-containing protein [Desulfobulbaceae bacterium]MDH3543072.1 DUF2062 domain-containing protein [Desulfobulbaceae bacterium]HKJ15346.1 DUF2062 domain-containing protein [Desulfobulbales bacterium]